MAKKQLWKLSITELLLLHGNYWASKDLGARYHLLNDVQFKAIEKELGKRINQINFQ